LTSIFRYGISNISEQVTVM